MRFTVRESVPFPPARVFAAERDELDAIVPFLPDVQRVVLRSDERGADGHRTQVHRWTGSAESIPLLLRAVVREDWLQWDQTTRWEEDRLSASWSIAVPALGAAVEARGVRRYEPDGIVCAVGVDGELTVRATGVDALVALPPSAVPFVERFAVGLVVPMIGRTTVAVGRYLQATDGRSSGIVRSGGG